MPSAVAGNGFVEIMSSLIGMAIISLCAPVAVVNVKVMKTNPYNTHV